MTNKNVLILIDKVDQKAFKTVINNLKQYFNVYLHKPIEPGDGIITENIRSKITGLIQFAKEKKIDFCLMLCHNQNPAMIAFQQEFSPTFGYYDFEHDLFQHCVNHSPKEKALGTFVFHKLYKNFMQKKEQKYFEARWYKFDAHTFAEDNVNYAMVVDARNIELDRSFPFEYTHLFEKVFLKTFPQKYTTELEKGIIVDREQYWTTQNLFTLGKHCSFWFVNESSAYIEALLLDRIPISWRNEERIKTISSVNSIVDEVFHEKIQRNMNIIIADEKKIAELQKSPELRNECLTLLKEQFVFDHPSPPISEILIPDMLSYCENA